MRTAALLAALAAATPAAAQGQRAYAVPAGPVSDAIVALADQAKISIAGSTPCNGDSPGFRGLGSTDAALTAILVGSTCRFERIDARTYRLLPRPTPRPQPARSTFVETHPGPLPELLVTATRRLSTLDRIAGGASLVAGSDLRRAGVRTASDLTGQLAGVTITNLGAGRDKIMLRGLSDGVFTGQAQSTVSVFLDTAPVTYNAPDPDLLLVDIEAVEVLRGPQGFIDSAGAMAGVYRIVTRKPKLDNYEGELFASFSATTGGAPGSSQRGMINLPLVKDAVGLRAVAWRQVDGGYIDDLTLQASNVGRTTREGARATVAAEDLAGWSLTLSGTWQEISANDTQYVSPSMGRFSRAREISEIYATQFSQLTLNGERTFDAMKVSASFSAGRRLLDTRADATAALPNFGAPGPGIGVFDEAIDQRSIFADVAAWSTGERAVEWLAGADLWVSRELTGGELRLRQRVAAGVVTRVRRENREDERLNLGAFGELTSRLRSDLTLAAGLRVSRRDLRTHSDLIMPLAGAPTRFTGERDRWELTPRIALQWDPAPNTVVYGLISQGGRSGGFNTAGFPDGVVDPELARSGLARSYEADTLWNFEGGLKTRLWDDRLRVRAAAFHALWSDVQTNQFLSSGLAYTANAGDARNLGLEAELSYASPSGLHVAAQAFANNPRLRRAAPAFAQWKDARLPGVPAISLGANVSRAFTLRPDVALSVSAAAEYVGASRVTFERAAPRMGDYVTARLSAELAARHWRLSASLDNPFDSSGDTFAYGNPFNFHRQREMTPQRPRTLTLGLAATF
ncbi:TonB-dependent receptor [Caulobacter segnis]|uniref:TonB-dependent receptor n=1 Tax=Caulobacter segnis TaxID=88688 RepID=UPI002410A865|nr:TonB-dependent receptor [Caulobacter segnis]MDG2520402.1 TonB-dependent receptor [Caulobacter segnis]